MDAINLLWSARCRNAHCLCQTSHRSLLFVKNTSPGRGLFVCFCWVLLWWFFFVVVFGLGVFCCCSLNTFSTLPNSLPWVSYLPPIVMNQLTSTRQCVISYSSSVDCDPFPKSKFHSSNTQKMVALESRLDQTLEARQKLWDKSDSNSDFKVHFHYLSKTVN